MKKVMESHGIFVGKFCVNPGIIHSNSYPIKI